jgi:hypothetical protein
MIDGGRADPAPAAATPSPVATAVNLPHLLIGH